MIDFLHVIIVSIMKNFLELSNYFLCVQYSSIVCLVAVIRILELFKLYPADVTYHPTTALFN